MGKLGPSSLGHIYREGSIQSLWRPVLGGVPGAGSTGSRETPVASLPAPGSVMAYRELRVGHGGNIYIPQKSTNAVHREFFSEIRVSIFYYLTVHYCMVH